MNNSLKIILVVALIIIIVGGSFALFFRGADFQRSWKTMKSNYTGGLNRCVIVYDYNGNELRRWEGKFDVSESENEVYFDYNNKRVIVHGGIIINEEVD